MSPYAITARFDDLIHAPTRLRITAALAAGTQLEFSALQEAVRISTSLLSKQLKVLADAGYVGLEKRPQPFGRPRTWIHLTSSGRSAYNGHLEALKQIIAGEPAGDTDTGPWAPQATAPQLSRAAARSASNRSVVDQWPHR